MSDKENDDPKKDQPWPKESFKGEQDKAQSEKEQQPKLEWDKLQQQKLEGDKLQQDKAQWEKEQQEKLQQEKLGADKQQQEKLMADKLQREKLQADKLQQNRAEWNKGQEEKLQWDKLQQQKLQADKLEQEKLIADKLQQDKARWEKEQQEKLEQERILTESGGQSAAPFGKLDPLELLKKIGLDWRPEKEKPPADPVFDNAYSGMKNRTPGQSFASAPDSERMKKLLAAIPGLQKQYVQGGRAERFYPYLLIRSVVGDRGDRPLISESPPIFSPDIWIASGDPDSNPPLPETNPPLPETKDRPAPLRTDSLNPSHSIPAPWTHGFGTDYATNHPHTLYAHVWNLGRAPIIGVKVEFLYSWFKNAFEIAHHPESVGLVGVARLDLAPRDSEHCHQRVKCPQALHLQRTNREGAETQMIVVRVSCIGDAVTDPWMPLNDRHVAFHFINVTG